ncbi:MAG: GNAT family N-acetyltransferase [Lachnospiraceae bacterium]|nr:GNAT family N-acetyltransferase [Lachnospiraceae bacterium]
MLKKVIFILDDEKSIYDIENLVDELALYGITVSIIGKPLRYQNTDETLSNQEIVNKCTRTEIIDTLYITDNPVYHNQLKLKGLPVIVYLHEGNRDKTFSYAEYAIEDIREIEYESLKLGYLRLTGQPWTILETDRCTIRESTVDDVDSFYEIYSEPSITKYMENLYVDRDEEVEYIKDYIKKVYSFYGYGMWTVLEKSSQTVIGRAGISWREGYDIPELGFVIAVPFQGQGYAYEVCQAIIKYGREELGFNSFQVLVMEGNEISMALCRKLGFEQYEKVEIDGTWYDRMIFHQSTKID